MPPPRRTTRPALTVPIPQPLCLKGRIMNESTRHPDGTHLAGADPAHDDLATALGPALDDPDRGDVPGWVMLTLMSAVLVAGLLLIAQPALEGLFNEAIARVTGA